MTVDKTTEEIDVMAGIKTLTLIGTLLVMGSCDFRDSTESRYAQMLSSHLKVSHSTTRQAIRREEKVLCVGVLGFRHGRIESTSKVVTSIHSTDLAGADEVTVDVLAGPGRIYSVFVNGRQVCREKVQGWDDLITGSIGGPPEGYDTYRGWKIVFFESSGGFPAGGSFESLVDKHDNVLAIGTRTFYNADQATSYEMDSVPKEVTHQITPDVHGDSPYQKK